MSDPTIYDVGTQKELDELLAKEHKSETLKEKLDSVKTRRLNLSGKHLCDLDCPPHRPVITLYGDLTDIDDDRPEKPVVCMSIHPLWGQPSRWAEMTPAEARTLGSLLIAAAIDVEQIVDSYVPPSEETAEVVHGI